MYSHVCSVNALSPCHADVGGRTLQCQNKADPFLTPSLWYEGIISGFIKGWHTVSLIRVRAPHQEGSQFYLLHAIGQFLSALAVAWPCQHAKHMSCRPAPPDLQRLSIFVIKNWSHNIPVNWLIHTNSRAVCFAFKCLLRLVLPPTLSPWGIFPSSVLSVLCFPFFWIINCVHDNCLTFLFFLFFLRNANLQWCHMVVGSSPAYCILWSILSFFSHSRLTRQRGVACVLNVSHLLASKKRSSYSTAAFQSSAQHFSEKRVKPELPYWVSSLTRNCAWESTWRAAHMNWDFFGIFVLLQLGKARHG